MNAGEGQDRPNRRRERRARPLDQPALQELAFGYVARFATSRAKLSSYLSRKLRERGWSGDKDPDVAAVVDKVVGLGFVDDAAFAGMKAASLTHRGYGRGRVRQALAASGIGVEDGSEALALAEDQQMAAALRFAQRRRIGPYAETQGDMAARQKALAAMLRAGHPMDLARRVVGAAPGDLEGLADDS
ncbi:RecX family transcriptional regulator [Sphingomonas kaistensis]|uniref:Regulatory protein RecX n=1 Tax=Sphingomonas kaistensis TaxID=298708 RepID=A0ABZ2FZM1_9SPHN